MSVTELFLKYHGMYSQNPKSATFLLRTKIVNSTSHYVKNIFSHISTGHVTNVL